MKIIIGLDGKPYVFYHGTPGGKFQEFDLSKSPRKRRWEYDEMYFFAFEKGVAAEYAESNGSIITVTLSANKILDTVKSAEDKALYDRWARERLENNDIVYTQGNAPLGYAEEHLFSYPVNWVGDKDGTYPYFENNEWLADEIKKYGYDAFITSEGNAKIGIAVFSKKQISIL